MEGRILLDIGSGHVKHEGWTRVDRASTRQRGFHDLTQYELDPDIACDLRAIPLPDDHADGARAIHVIEHFYPWEALDLVKEWVRVIKPGAELAIECPSLEKVIALAQVPEVQPRFLHWPLYGDPRHRDPDMMHKWAYTRPQLGKLMVQAGLENVRPEPTQFHQAIRDMRMVGNKPLEQSRVILPNQ